MGQIDKALNGLGNINLGTLTTTGANETFRQIVPSGNLPFGSAASVPVRRYNLAERIGPAEVWRPIGISWAVTTGITVTAAVVQLQRNGVAPNGPSATAALNGIVTLPIQALSALLTFYGAFSDYTFAAPDAAADAWSVKVITTSTAGVVNPVNLWYAQYIVPGINVGFPY